MGKARRYGWSDYLVWLLVACAGVVVVLVLGRLAETHLGWPVGSVPEAQGFVNEWQDIAGTRHSVGAGDPKVTMVLFMDFQCPYCRTFARSVADAKEHFGDDLATVFRHYPLPIHPHAEDAAAASECARRQGVFREYHDVLFERQQAIGSKSWSAFAIAAGVRDLAQFDQCLVADSALATVRRDVLTGVELDITGTPTFILNGSLYKGAMSAASLRRAIARHMREEDMR